MGFFLLGAKKFGIEAVTGIDISPQQVEAARSLGVNAIHVEDGATWLRRNENQFDRIFLFDVLEHIPVNEQPDFCRDIYSALAPGGQVLIRVPNANSSFAGRYRYIDWTHTCSFTEPCIHFLLASAGFSLIKTGDDYFGRLPLWFPRLRPTAFLRAIHYGVRRLQTIAEFGVVEAKRIPITLNMVTTATKQ